MAEGMKEGKSGKNSRANGPARVLIQQDGWREKKVFTNRISGAGRHGNTTNLLGVHKASLLLPYADKGPAACIKVFFSWMQLEYRPLNASEEHAGCTQDNVKQFNSCLVEVGVIIQRPVMHYLTGRALSYLTGMHMWDTLASHHHAQSHGGYRHLRHYQTGRSLLHLAVAANVGQACLI